MSEMLMKAGNGICLCMYDNGSKRRGMVDIPLLSLAKLLAILLQVRFAIALDVYQMNTRLSVSPSGNPICCFYASSLICTIPYFHLIRVQRAMLCEL